MESTFSAQNADHTQVGHTSSIASWLTRLEATAEFNRYAIISIGFLVIGIVGGIVVGFFARPYPWQIATVIGFTMFALTLMLAVAPMKWILRFTAAALLVDVLVVVINLV